MTFGQIGSATLVTRHSTGLIEMWGRATLNGGVDDDHFPGIVDGAVASDRVLIGV